MAKTFAYEVVSFQKDRVFVGIDVRTSETAMFQDAKQLANTYGKIKDKIKNQITPVHTAVITMKKDQEETFRYFMGDEVSSMKKLVDPLVSMVLPKGTMVAKVSVPVGSQLTLSYKVAEIRKQFYTTWLNEHPYVSHPIMEDMELYHYRRKRFRKSLKMVMELYFFIEEKVSE